MGDKVKAELETNPKSMSADSYSCAIKSKHS